MKVIAPNEAFEDALYPFLHKGVTFQTLNTAYCIKTQLLLSPSQPMQDYYCWITAH